MSNEQKTPQEVNDDGGVVMRVFWDSSLVHTSACTAETSVWNGRMTMIYDIRVQKRHVLCRMCESLVGC